MKVRDIMEPLELEVLTPTIVGWEDREIHWGYCSDLLSLVMAETHAGDLWVTRQLHINVVAVALLNDLTAVIMCGKKPEEAVIRKALEEETLLLHSGYSVFDTAGLLYERLREQRGEKS